MLRCILLSFLCLAPTLFASEDLFERSDSEITGPPYEAIYGQFETLARKHSAIAQWIPYGKSVLGRTLALMIVYKPSVEIDSRPTLLMSGATHGNEYLGIEDRLPAELLELTSQGSGISHFIENGGAFVFVPILNPDGYDLRTRENANKIDLNRDWDVPTAHFSAFTQSESLQLSSQLEEFTKAPFHFSYKLTVDYHCCTGAVLYPWSHKADAIPSLDMEKHQNVAALAEKQLGIEHGTTSQILGYYAMGTTKDYYYNKYGAIALTYEGRRKEETSYFSKHVAWWKDIVELFSDAKNKAFFSLQKKRRHPLFLIAD